jgi:anti-sigma-K factor RskA
MTVDPRHEEFLDTAAAWVLGALPDDEAGAFSEHLASCSICAAEVARRQAVVEVLPFAAEPARPSPDLKARVMGDVTREAELLAAGGPQAGVPRRPPRASRLQRLLARPWIAVTGVAAVLAVGVAIGWIASDPGGERTLTRPVTIAKATPDATGELVTRGDHTELKVRDAPAPPSGRVYQVWIVRDGTPAPDAVFTVDRQGSGSVVLQGSLDDASTVLVTDEPAGGSTAPTTEPVMSAAVAS